MALSNLDQPAKMSREFARSVTDARSILQELRRASDDADFRLSDAHAIKVTDVGLRLPRCEDPTQEDDYHKFLEGMMAAAGHGMKLVAGTLGEQQKQAQAPAPDSGVVALVRLQCALIACQTRSCATPGLLAPHAGSPDLLAGMQQLATALAKHWSTPASPSSSRTQQQDLALAVLTSCLMRLLPTVLPIPGNQPTATVGAASLLASAAAAIAALAVAALRNKDALFIKGVGSNTSSSSSSSSSPATSIFCPGGSFNSWSATLRMLELWGTTEVAAHMAAALQQMLVDSSKHGGAAARQAAQIASSSAVKQLLLVRAALLVQQRHQQQEGLPAVGASQQRSVPPHHRRLLQQLGTVHWVRLDAAASAAGGKAGPTAELAGALACLQGSFAGISSSSGSDSADGAASHLVPVALLLVECMLLEPSAASLQLGSKALQDVMASNSSKLSSAGGTLSLQAAWALQQRVAQELVPALLWQLLPAARQLQPSSAAAGQQSPAGPEAASHAAVMTQLSGVLLAHVMSVDLLLSAPQTAGQQPAPGGGPSANDPLSFLRNMLSAVTSRERETDRAALGLIVAAFEQHATDYALLLEAGLRAGSNSGSIDTQQLAEQRARGAAAAAMLFMQAVQGASLSRTGAPTLTLGSKQFGSAVFPLLISCLKAASAAPGPQAASAAVGGLQLKVVQRTFAGLLSMAGLHFDGNRRGLVTACSSRTWCVLFGRCFVALGKLLQQQPSGSPGEEAASRLYADKVSACMGLADELIPLDHFCKELVEANAAPSAARAAAAGGGNRGGMLQLPPPALLQVASGFVQVQDAFLGLSLANMTTNCGGGGVAMMGFFDALGGGAPLRTPTAAKLAQLSALGASLEAFGAAVCGLLPTKQCCNHHGCSNLAGLGEQQLASGPTCVCSGCRAARYCSAACQKAHWKGWHKAVCKR